MFIKDEEATEELHRVMAELKAARERCDGSYGRMMAEALDIIMEDDSPQ